MSSKVSKPFIRPTLTELPDYLGFGKLDKSSRLVRKGAVSARYQLEGATTCTVLWQPGDCRIDSYYDEAVFASFVERDLRKAFYLLFASMLQKAPMDPQFLNLYQRVLTASPNIHFQIPDLNNSPFVYYPAGLIIRLRQVLTDDNRHAYEKLKQEMTGRDDCPVTLVAEGQGTITRFLIDGRRTEEAIHMVEFHALLFHLLEAVRLITKSCLSLQGNEYRLDIGIPGSSCIYQGEPERGYTAFTVRFEADELKE